MVASAYPSLLGARRLAAVLALLLACLVAVTATASNNAWMIGNQPSNPNDAPNPALSFNPVAPGTINVQRAAQGVYQITFTTAPTSIRNTVCW